MRVGALERERAASHQGWLSLFGRLLGDGWLERRAGRLQLALLRAQDADEVGGLRSEVERFLRSVNRTPLIKRRLRGIGALSDEVEPLGPVARAEGFTSDARAAEEVYQSLGFEPVVRDEDDALSRLRVRLAEVSQSLGLVDCVGSISASEGRLDGEPSGEGVAIVETPRGTARLRVTLEERAVSAVELDSPSTRHLGLIGGMVEQRELADALVGVASLDLSPWEVVR